MISARKIMALGLAAFLLMAAGTAQAELLLLDTFNNVEIHTHYSDYGVNQELATRQSGTYADTSYNISYYATNYTQVYVPTYGQTLYTRLGGGTRGWMALEQDFGIAELTTVSVTMRPIVGDESSGNDNGSYYSMVGVLGADSSPNGAAPHVSTDVGATLLVRSDGSHDYGWMYYNNAVLVSYGSVTAADTYDVVVTTDGNKLSAWIDGTQVVDDHTLVGDAATRIVNYVSVGTGGGTYTSPSTFDDLQVSKIPEPTTLVMLFTGLIGLLAYAWRRRK